MNLAQQEYLRSQKVKEIEDSFNNIIDDQFRQDINKIFGI